MLILVSGGPPVHLILERGRDDTEQGVRSQRWSRTLCTCTSTSSTRYAISKPVCVPDVNDPLWAELAEIHLVERRGVVFPYWSLTMRGRLYKTD
jgi:hypothetical protein